MEVSLHQKNTIGKMNLEEMMMLNAYLVSQIKAERSVQASRVKRELTIGTVVKFEDGRGNTIQGVVAKVMRKYAKVNDHGSIWRVPICVLQKVGV